MCVNVSALWGKSKPSHPYNRRHAPVLTSLISLWELHQWSSPLPVLPSMQSSMTCLCLETSLPMQRSHWHLMSQHFSQKLMSGISTATTDSVPCIIGLLKPRRHHDMVTHPPKGDQDLSRSHVVFTTCDLEVLRSPLGQSMPWTADQLWQVLVIRRSCQVTMDPRQRPPEPDSANHPNIDQPWWVLHCLSVLPGEKILKNLQVNLPQKQYMIQQCQPALDWCTMWALSEVKANPVIRTTEDMLRCWPHWSVCENCISGLHHCQFYPACNQAWPVCVWRLVCQCREVIDTLCPSISAENWCLESVLPLPIPCLALLAC